MRKHDKLISIVLSAGIFFFALVVTLVPKIEAQQTDQASRQYIDRIQYAFNFILQNYVDEIPPEQLYEGAMKGMFESLEDQYSYYLTASDMADLSDTTTGKFGGVGLYISKPIADEDNDTYRNEHDIYIKVVAPIEDTPAYRAGIHAGDYISKIEGESTKNMTVDDVVERLRGTPGSQVTVTILRGKDISFDVTLTRAIIEIPTVKYDLIHDHIAYIRIIQFTPYTADRVEEALTDLRERGYDSLIIDVRGNPGGLLESVVDTADLILDLGPIVSTRSRVPSENEVFYANQAQALEDEAPIVVLIDEGSASASEILAGALKDTGRAVLVGRKTFGKGSVQKIIPFGDGGFKLTISRYYTPSGVNIDKVGIEPALPISEPELSEEENKDLKRLFEERMISRFVDENPDADEAAREDFARELQQTRGINLDTELLRRLIRNEFHRRMDSPPVFDLKYDSSLQKAVEIIENETYSEYLPEPRVETRSELEARFPNGFSIHPPRRQGGAKP
ncbi:MAG TPA: S41 family peptidase [Sediminispirochaeta sp.]|nr:S41 family peptidase [Sediminispirochaeta sp.]